jgi:hypothetical protein
MSGRSVALNPRAATPKTRRFASRLGSASRGKAALGERKVPQITASKRDEGGELEKKCQPEIECEH